MLSRPLSSFQFPVSAQYGIVALGKAHTRSAPSLSSLPKVALETVPIFVWLNTDRSRLWRVERRPLPLSTSLSFTRSMLSCSGLSMFRKFLKPRSTSALAWQPLQTQHFSQRYDLTWKKLYGGKTKVQLRVCRSTGRRHTTQPAQRSENTIRAPREKIAQRRCQRYHGSRINPFLVKPSRCPPLEGNRGSNLGLVI